MSPQTVSALVATAHRMADAARPETLKHFRQPTLQVDSKAADFDPVTVADRSAEAAMRAILEAERPDDGILGEEYGAKDGTTGLTWVLDPIDGTRGYIAGTPTWAVLIAIADETGPIYGIIDQPYIGERFEGGFGRASVTGPTGETALGARAPRRLDEAIILTTFPEVGSPEEGAAFHRVAAETRLTRYGMDAYGYALLAAGQVGLVIESGLQTYDYAAPAAVIRAAGGIVTNWQGDPSLESGQILAAANEDLLQQALVRLSADGSKSAS
ncbi:MAG: inositol monophosphatase family protein [Pseudomonadota bacterium]